MLFRKEISSLAEISLYRNEGTGKTYLLSGYQYIKTFLLVAGREIHDARPPRSHRLRIW